MKLKYQQQTNRAFPSMTRLAPLRSVYVARAGLSVIRTTAIACRSQSRSFATEKLKAPSSEADNVTQVSSPKIEQIVSSISKLTLLETAQLVKMLKEELNIQDAFMSMPMSAPGAVAGQAAAAPAQEAEPEKPAEKTEFTVRLDKFDAAAKAKVIRELKGILPGANLVEAKKFAEAAPKVIRDKVPKEEAEKIKKVLEAVGASVTLE